MLPIARYIGDPSIASLGPADADDGAPEINTDAYSVIINGLVNPRGISNKTIRTCPTGNCTFQADSAGITHSSMAACSKCIDYTSLTVYNTTKKDWCIPGSGLCVGGQVEYRGDYVHVHGSMGPASGMILFSQQQTEHFANGRF